MCTCVCVVCDSVWVYISNFNPKLQYTWNRDTLTAMSALSTQILASKYQFPLSETGTPQVNDSFQAWAEKEQDEPGISFFPEKNDEASKKDTEVVRKSKSGTI